MPYPYNNEEDFLTPGFNPSLPPPIKRRPLPLIGAGAPGSMPAPTYQPEEGPGPTRSQRYQSEKEGFMRGTPGRAKSAGLGALRGFLGGGLTGAVRGAIGAAVDPKEFREQEFNQRMRPQILERFGMEDQENQARRQAEQDALNAQYKQAQIGELGSQVAYRQGQLGVAQENARRQGGVAQSTIELNDARAEAARRGTPVYQDIDEGNGKITKYAIFPDGSMRSIGPSGSAAISREGIQSREKLAGQHERGEYSRAAMREAGADRRADQRGQKKTIPITKIREAVKASGGKMSTSEVKARFISQGYRIVE